MKKFALALIAMATLGSTSALAERVDRPGRPGPGRPNEVIGLGSVRLGALTRSRVIQINSCAGADPTRIDAIYLHAAVRSANLRSLAVQFGNGQVGTLNLGYVLPEGRRTQWIDLGGAGRGRCVRAIQIVGSSAAIIKHAEIDIYGLRSWDSLPTLQDQQ